jgi:hypothetical protein
MGRRGEDAAPDDRPKISRSSPAGDFLVNSEVFLPGLFLYPTLHRGDSQRLILFQRIRQTGDQLLFLGSGQLGIRVHG